MSKVICRSFATYAGSAYTLRPSGHIDLSLQRAETLRVYGNLLDCAEGNQMIERTGLREIPEQRQIVRKDYGA